MLKRCFAIAAAGLATIAAGCTSAAAQQLPSLKQKDSYKIGFSQPGSASPWRMAQRESMLAEANKLGHQLVYTDAGGSTPKQVADMSSLIAESVDLIFLAPREEKPLVPAVMAAKQAGIPVILLDRNVDQSLAKAGRDYVTFIGSDFVEQGRRAAEALTKAVNGSAQIIQIEGVAGSTPANDRRRGFEEYIGAHPGMKIVASQPGDFERTKGYQVAEALWKTHPNVNAIYAHNDGMALGAIAALEDAGKKPGYDVMIVSADGTRDALQAIIDSKLLATVETSPHFGPKAFEIMVRYARGEQIEPWVVNTDRLFDKTNAAQFIKDAF